MITRLPNEIKLTNHAHQRLIERKNKSIEYNTKNLMRSSVKWYGKNDLIHDCALYRHSCYTTRKSSQMGYITDGEIEIIYNKNTKTAITVLEVKDKFKPITQFINPELLNQIQIKKEQIKMKKKTLEIGTCPDCETNNTTIVTNGIYAGICEVCKRRKQNAKARGITYIPYVVLTSEEKKKIDARRNAQNNKSKLNSTAKTIKNAVDPLANQFGFIQTLRSYGCEIPEENLKNVLNVLTNTDKLKDILMIITENDNQQAMLDLEQALNVVERKLQHDWEYNGFQETDDIKFKEFLTYRRTLKGAIFFWKKLYQTNTIIEMQRAWNSYTHDPNDKILLAGDKIDSTLKRFQISTESISPILNTRRPFTRVFYATDQDSAYDMFVKWMADRQLHENKAKTIITELKGDDITNGKK